VDHIIGKGSQKRLLMEIPPTQKQQENKGQDRRTLSRRMHCRSQVYKDRGNKLGIEKNGGTSLMKARAQRGLWCHACMDGLIQHVEQV
jgi:hypothetical protein